MLKSAQLGCGRETPIGISRRPWESSGEFGKQGQRYSDENFLVRRLRAPASAFGFSHFADPVGTQVVLEDRTS